MTVRRVVTVLVTASLAGAAGASTAMIWFSEEFLGLGSRAHGYDTVGGKTMIVLAGLGVICALAGGWIRGPWPWIASLLLALASVGAVVIAAATYKAHGPAATTWTATRGYWVSLAVTIAWSTSVVIAAYVLRRSERFSGMNWLGTDLRPVRARLTLAFIAAFASCFFALIGALGPWKSAGVASLSGVDGSGDGLIVLGAAFFAALGLLSFLGLGSRRALLEVRVLGVAAAATSIYWLQDIDDESAVATGWGLNLDVCATVVLTGSTLILLFGQGRSLVPPASVETAQSAAAEPELDEVEPPSSP